ncbi:MAG: tetratricopeptide repeat protein [Gammaproteobacteria bacterium]
MNIRMLMRNLPMVLFLVGVFAGQVVAAEKKYTVSQKTYKVLEQSRTMMDQREYRGALAKLRELLPKVEDNRYEAALINQHMAFVYLEQGDYVKGVAALENTLANADTLPPDTVRNLRYNLAQAAAQTENFAKAEHALDLWFADAQKPSADAWYLRGLVQYKRHRLARAADYLKQALTLSHHENWTLLLLSIYLEQKQYDPASELLRKLVNYYPANKQYWMNLTDVYLMRQNYAKALATLQLARYSIKLDETELLKLVGLYLHNNIPYKAAVLMQQAISEGKVKSNAANLELLANSWAAAREPDKELHYLKQAANLKNDGNLYHRCAQILLRQEQWREAVAMFDAALAKGIKSPGQSYLLKGIAAYQSGQMKIAANAFKQAGQYRKTKNQAKQWLSQVKAVPAAS